MSDGCPAGMCSLATDDPESEIPSASSKPTPSLSRAHLTKSKDLLREVMKDVHRTCMGCAHCVGICFAD